MVNEVEELVEEGYSEFIAIATVADRADCTIEELTDLYRQHCPGEA